jgi:hypothetical protein
MGRLTRDTVFEEGAATESLPTAGEIVSILCSVVRTDDGDAAGARGVAIFHDADGEELAVDDKLPLFGPDAGGHHGVRATVVGLRAGGDGLRVRVSLARPDGLATEDGREELEVYLDQLKRGAR